jgi:type IV fimbrial biogenesis protein FimT
MNHSHLAQRGFTLIELMFAMVLAAILLALAVPAFQDARAKSQVKAAATDISAALATARSESIRRGKRVVVCPSTDGATCADEEWDKGWITFVDDGTVPYSWDGTETILSKHTQLNLGILVSYNDHAKKYIAYGPDGRTRTSLAAVINPVIRLCTDRTDVRDDDRARDVSVFSTGRLSVTKPTGIDSSCPDPS